MSTQALLVTGTGGLAAESITQIGANITMPAGGPWTIFALWGMAAQDTAVASEAVSGGLLVDALICPRKTSARFL